MLDDPHRPISVRPLGVCAEFTPANLPERAFTGGAYTMSTRPTAAFSAVREIIPEEQFILVAYKGSLERNIRDGFRGYDMYRYENDNGGWTPVIELAGFPLPTAIVDSFVDAALESGSFPVVFADQDGDAFVVRYHFDFDCLSGIQVLGG